MNIHPFIDYLGKRVNIRYFSPCSSSLILALHQVPHLPQDLFQDQVWKRGVHARKGSTPVALITRIRPDLPGLIAAQVMGAISAAIPAIIEAGPSTTPAYPRRASANGSERIPAAAPGRGTVPELGVSAGHTAKAGGEGGLGGEAEEQATAHARRAWRDRPESGERCPGPLRVLRDVQ